MQLTKRQKLFMGILVIAGVGLICDRVFILPLDAEARSLDPTAEYLAQEAKLSASVSESGSNKTISDRLDRLIPDGRLGSPDVRDIFALSSAWSDTLVSENPRETSQKVMETFLKRHKLKGIVLHGTRTRVYVDDRVMYPGDRLEGLTLTEVDETSATFSGQGLRVVLRLRQD